MAVNFETFTDRTVVSTAGIAAVFTIDVPPTERWIIHQATIVDTVSKFPLCQLSIWPLGASEDRMFFDFVALPSFVGSAYYHVGEWQGHAIALPKERVRLRIKTNAANATIQIRLTVERIKL